MPLLRAGLLLACLLLACLWGCTSENAALGTDAGTAGAAGAPATPQGEDEHLSNSELYLDDMQTLGPGVMQFEPAHALWADGADKQRFLWLPPGASIDTGHADRWNYPVGAKFWKSFSKNGMRLETRLLEKRATGWFMMAYVWDESGSDARAAPDGRVDALGTSHDVPNQDDCRACHAEANDVVLGFTALQLAAQLEALERKGLLSDPLPETELPGDTGVRAALGYLHANCGSCHRPGATVYEQQTPLDLWLRLDGLETLESTTTFTTAVGRPTHVGDDDSLLLIAPGDPQASAVWLRMATRERVAMPPVASDLVDAAGLEQIGAFISGLERP